MKSRKLRELMHDSYSIGSIGGLAAGVFLGGAFFIDSSVLCATVSGLSILMIFLSMYIHYRHVDGIMKKRMTKKIEAAKDAENTE